MSPYFWFSVFVFCFCLFFFFFLGAAQTKKLKGMLLRLVTLFSCFELFDQKQTVDGYTDAWRQLIDSRPHSKAQGTRMLRASERARGQHRTHNKGAGLSARLAVRKFGWVFIILVVRGVCSLFRVMCAVQPCPPPVFFSWIA